MKSGKITRKLQLFEIKWTLEGDNQIAGKLWTSYEVSFLWLWSVFFLLQICLFHGPTSCLTFTFLLAKSSHVFISKNEMVLNSHTKNGKTWSFMHKTWWRVVVIARFKQLLVITLSCPIHVDGFTNFMHTYYHFNNVSCFWQPESLSAVCLT